MTTKTTTKDASQRDGIREIAELYGFISGKDAGYSQPDLWLKDSDGGGHVSVYPANSCRVNGKGKWTLCFFGKGANVPFASHNCNGFEEAMVRATGQRK